MSATTVPSFWSDADVQLMLDARQGDTDKLAALMEKHYAPVLRYCSRHVRDFAIAQELAQEVFLRVHRSRSKYQASARFTTWLYRIASNVVLNWIRDTSRDRVCERIEATRTRGFEMQVADDTPRIDDWLEFEALAAEVRRAVEDLPERQRTVVIMRNFEDMTGAEIAETLGCSHQAVRSLLCRAYATLRERLVDFQPTVQ